MTTGRAFPGHGSHLRFTRFGVMRTHTRAGLSHSMKASMALRLTTVTELLAETAARSSSPVPWSHVGSTLG